MPLTEAAARRILLSRSGTYASLNRAAIAAFDALNRQRTSGLMTSRQFLTSVRNLGSAYNRLYDAIVRGGRLGPEPTSAIGRRLRIFG